MPITKIDDVIREITMMVRKGTIQFDLNDRPVLDLNRTDKRTGKKISYCVGSIGRDDDNSGLFFTLYTTDGKFVPSKNGLRPIESLYGKELIALRDSVARYFDMSLNRAKNLENIAEFLVGHNEGYQFESDMKPSAYVDPALDGKMVEVKIDSIFYPDPAVSLESSLLYSGQSDGGVKVTGTVQSLNDRAVSNLVNCMGIEKKISLVQQVEIDKPRKRAGILKHTM